MEDLDHINFSAILYILVNSTNCLLTCIITIMSKHNYNVMYAVN
jgi:hypothetical protein